jgi:rhodanese-related sulfurtransferase
MRLLSPPTGNGHTMSGMPTEVDAVTVEKVLRDENALLLEVLPALEYEEEHLPGALNIPLKELTATAAANLDHTRPTIVYCHDDL